MNLKTSRSDLLNALNSVSVALSSKSANPYGAFVLLVAKDKTLTIVADSIQLRAEASVKCEITTAGEALISHSKLTALLQREGSTVSLAAENNRLKVEVGGSLTHLPSMPTDAFPAPRVDSDQKAFVILDNQAFSSALSVVCQFAGDGLSHLWNTGLLILDDGKDLTVAACDGKQFARFILPTSGSTFKAVTPAKLIRTLVNLFQAKDSLTMAVGNNHISFDMEGLAIQIRQAEDGYPDARMLEVCERTAKLCNHEVTVDREGLISELQIAGGIMERDEIGVGIEVSTSPQSVIVSALSKTTADHSLAIDARATVPMARRRINHGNMVGILRSLDCERVTIFYNLEAEPNGFRVSPEGSDCIQAALVFFKDL